jgi:superfamily I DNA/RNA helicase
VSFAPNAEQRAAIDAIDGDFVVIAGPGAGKTATLIQRYLNMITTHAISATDILNLTFTNSAATEMVQRVGLLGAESVFRTFHSFALDLLKRERAHVPFELTDTVIPVYGEDFQLMKNLLQTYPAISSFRSLKDKLSEWKRSNVDPEDAKQQTYHAGVDFFYACAYADYEKRCREEGWLDFDSLMKETVKLLEDNNEVRIRNQWKYISVDEAQDTDVVQASLLHLIYGGNAFFVGDSNQLVYQWRSAQPGNLEKFVKDFKAKTLFLGQNYRCHPPGELITCCVGQSRIKRGSRAIIKKIPIDKMSTTIKAVSWDKDDWYIHLRGRKTETTSYDYKGRMLVIKTETHKEVSLTPNHDLLIRVDKKAAEGKHLVYLMWRKDRGFRIGKSAFITKGPKGNRVIRIWHRAHTQKPDKMWFLSIEKTSRDAYVTEQILSSKYGITQMSFVPKGGGRGGKVSKKEIDQVFACRNDERGFRCLTDFELLFTHPLVSSEKGCFHIVNGYIRTAAANAIPRLMLVPTKQNLMGEKIVAIKKTWHDGIVFSLTVERDHNYFVNDICVGNSSKRLVEFFKKILPVDNGIASHMISEREEGVVPVITKYADEVQEANAVLNQIVDVTNTAIIARTNRQVMRVQKACLARDIKSKILGRKDLWQQNEVKHLLKLAEEQTGIFHIPASEVLIELIHNHNLAHIYRSSGGPNEPDPIENLNNIVKLSAKRGTIAEFLKWLRRLTYARKSEKNPTLSLTTVHQAKGREWRHVFVIGCNQGLMPHKDGELLEEHRIFFVACSRAADSLHISYYGSPSQFLNEFRSEIQRYES